MGYSGEDQRRRQVGIDLPPVRRVGRHHELPLHHAQRVVLPHQPLHPLATDLPTAGLQFPLDPPASIAGPPQGCLLQLAAQIHVFRRGLGRVQKTVVARAAEPATSHIRTSRRRSSTGCKARFKKSISMACWPTLRSNTATGPSSARFFPHRRTHAHRAPATPAASGAVHCDAPPRRGLPLPLLATVQARHRLLLELFAEFLSRLYLPAFPLQ